jgi:hypothetical protein
MPSPQQLQRTWRTVAGSQSGLSHERSGAPCQDAIVAFQRGPTLYLAMADGAGSAPHGRLGAKTAVKVGASWLRQNAPAPTDGNWPDGLRRAVSAVRLALRRAARLQHASVDELACTFLIAVAHPKGAIAAHIGDGGCVLRLAEGNYRVLSASRHDGAANRTDFVTAPRLNGSLRFAVCNRAITGLAAFTDGLEAGALNSRGEPHPGFFDPLFPLCDKRPGTEGVKELAAFLRSDHLRSHTDDDCTLLLAGVREASS